jgi:hypothetical protein
VKWLRDRRTSSGGKQNRRSFSVRSAGIFDILCRCGMLRSYLKNVAWSRSYDGLAMGAALRLRIRATTAPAPKPINKSWRVDEAYLRVKGRWCYLYRAIDSAGAPSISYCPHWATPMPPNGCFATRLIDLIFNPASSTRIWRRSTARPSTSSLSPAQASLALRPAESIARLKADFYPEASIRPVAQPDRSVASTSTDNYMGGFLLHK